jgi:hypothetical protein
MPTLGDTKPCILGDGGETGCDGTMEWKTVRPPDAIFTKDGAEVPEPPPPEAVAFARKYHVRSQVALWLIVFGFGFQAVGVWVPLGIESGDSWLGRRARHSLTVSVRR